MDNNGSIEFSQSTVSPSIPSVSFGNSRSVNQENITEDQINKYEFKIVLIGDSAVGKTCLIQRYLKDQFTENLHCSLGVEFQNKTVILDEKTIVDIKIWDTCGEEKFKAVTQKYYRDANGILVLFDLTSPTSFSNIEGWIKQIENTININKIPIILIGAKSDLDKKVKSVEIDQIILKYGFIEYIEISSKTGTNVEIVFDKIIREMINQYNIEEENDGTGDIFNNLSRHRKSLRSIENSKSNESTTSSKCC